MRFCYSEDISFQDWHKVQWHDRLLRVVIVFNATMACEKLSWSNFKKSSKIIVMGNCYQCWALAIRTISCRTCKFPGKFWPSIYRVKFKEGLSAWLLVAVQMRCPRLESNFARRCPCSHRQQTAAQRGKKYWHKPTTIEEFPIWGFLSPSRNGGILLQVCRFNFETGEGSLGPVWQRTAREGWWGVPFMQD